MIKIGNVCHVTFKYFIDSKSMAAWNQYFYINPAQLPGLWLVKPQGGVTWHFIETCMPRTSHMLSL